MISSSTTVRWPHNSHTPLCASLSTARVANTTCAPRPPAPCSATRGCWERRVVVVDIALSLLEDLDEDVLQTRHDGLDRDQRHLLRAEVGEQVVEPVLVRDGATYATLAVCGRDREALEPRRRGRGAGIEGTAQPDFIGLLAVAPPRVT